MIAISFNSTIISKSRNDEINVLTEEAIKISPKLQMLNSKHNASASRTSQETNLPDPMLTLGLINMPTNSFSFTQEPMTGKIIGLSQQFPFPGTFSSEEEYRAIDTLIIKKEIEDYKNQLRRDIAQLYFKLQQVRDETEKTKEIESLLSQISKSIKSRYQVVDASLQNVIQVEVQKTRVEDRMEVLRNTEISIISELNVILMRDENTPINTYKIEKIDKPYFTYSSLIDTAKNYRPFLKGIQLAETKSQYLEQSVNHSSYPGFKVGIQYTQRDYYEPTGHNWSDLFSVIVGISIPINYGSKNSEKVNEAKHLQAVYRDQYSASIQSLKQSFAKIDSKLNELLSREKLIESKLVPQSKQLLRAALNDYKVGNIDFINVIDAVKDIMNIKIELGIVRTDYSIALSELEFLVGKKLLN